MVKFFFLGGGGQGKYFVCMGVGCEIVIYIEFDFNEVFIIKVKFIIQLEKLKKFKFIF